MDVVLIIEFIESINKIAVVAFFLTSIFVAYEVYLLIKQKKKEEKPVIPEFKGDQSYGQIKVATVKPKEEKKIYRRPNTKLIIILIVLMVFFAVVYLVGLSVKGRNSFKGGVSEGAGSATIASQGIEIYSPVWQKIEEDEFASFQGGEKIFIGIKTIPRVDIDKARIRVNSDQWRIEDETSALKKELNLYYIEYQVATGQSQLKIEAQLHSASEDWLAEQDEK